MEDKTVTKTRTAKVKRVKIRSVDWEKVKKLLDLYALDKEQKGIRNEIVVECQGLIDLCSAHFYIFKQSFEDLIQEGEDGLMEEIDRAYKYDFDKFRDKATKAIRTKMQKHVNKISKGFNFLSLREILSYGTDDQEKIFNFDPDKANSFQKKFDAMAADDFQEIIKCNKDLNETFNGFDLLTKSIMLMKFYLRDTIEDIAIQFHITIVAVEEKIIAALEELRAIVRKKLILQEV